MAKKPASIKDCVKSLSFLRPMRDGGYISETDHDRIVGRVRRDLAKNGGVAGLEREGRRKRMAGGYVPDFHIPAPQLKHANNENYGPHDEESLNWHERAGYDGMYPVGGYDPELPQSAAGNQFAGANVPQTTGYGSFSGQSLDTKIGGYGYARGGANPMGSMRGRFADLSGIHQQTHAASVYGGGYDPAPQGRQPVLVHERSYYTDEPPSLFRDARGVSDGAMQRLRNALMGMFDDR